MVSQLNTITGDISGNCEKIIRSVDIAGKQAATLLVFQELVLCGYIPKDLLEYPYFKSECEQALGSIVEYSKNFPSLILVIGAPEWQEGKVFNSAYVIQNAQVIGIQQKLALPNYDVFDEKRYFSAGTNQTVFELNGQRVGVSICEDAWPETQYSDSRCSYFKERSLDLLINISASPFEDNKEKIRDEVFCKVARSVNCEVIMVNSVGANDDLIFDGRSLWIDKKGNILFKAPYFEEGCYELTKSNQKNTTEELVRIEKIKQALEVGIHDYVKKTNNTHVIIGLSGGIDSAVTCALAVKALGAKQVKGVLMPSRFSSEGSISDAESLASQLGIKTETIPIEPIVSSYSSQLGTLFEGLGPDVTEENLQSRIRGSILMAVANKFKALVLTTGNKSEVAVGYCTLYGDTNGALSVLSDVPKTIVYELAQHINSNEIIIPINSIEKPPSAELRPNQIDQDSLPDYEVLDRLIESIVVNKKGKKELIKDGYSEEMVSKTWSLIKYTEFKRSQLPIGLKISEKSFGSGRRFPIVGDY